VTPQQIWTFTRRWLWLLLLATLLAAVASYVVSTRLPKVYEGSAKLLVTPGQPGNGASNYNDVLAAERLTRTYSEVLKTQPVVDEAARRVGINLPYESLATFVTVNPVRDTQLVQVTARAGDPDTAANFANQLANVFIEQTQASQSSRFGASKESLGRQVDQLASDIAAHTSDVDTLRAQEPSATRDGELTRVQAELTQLQQSYGTAVRAFEDVRMSEARSSDLLAVVEPASPAPNAVQPRVGLNVALAALVGLLVALGGAFLVEYLDDRLLSPERLTHFTGLHALGSIPLLPKDTPQTIDRLPAASPAPDGQPSGTGYDYGYGGSNVGEAYRLLRANLQFAAVERPLRTLLVTSGETGDGKSTMAANLAIVMAQAGQKVLLVDADLRKPTLHELFGVPNRAGLTSLIVDEKLPTEKAIVATRVDGLRLIPSGPLPPNPSELLASQRMRERLEELSKLADLVVLDSPPVLPVSDPAVLAGFADGTLMVINTQHTAGQRAADAAHTLRSAGANLLGAVLNRVPRRGGSYYGYYRRSHGAPPEPKVTVSAEA
jgi:capsular exopolysaccharide synthesis family protein